MTPREHKQYPFRMPPDLHTAAAAIANIRSRLRQPRPGTNEWTYVRVETINDALIWLCRNGLDHASMCIDEAVDEATDLLKQERQFLEFFLDNPTAKVAMKSDFPDGSLASQYFDGVASDENGEPEPLYRHIAIDNFEFAEGRLSRFLNAQEAVKAIFEAEEAEAKRKLEEQAEREARFDEWAEAEQRRIDAEGRRVVALHDWKTNLGLS